MAFERTWTAVPPVLLIANGTTEGIITVSDSAGFYVKQLAVLTNNTPYTLNVQIKRVVDSTTLYVGIPGPSMLHNLDVSAFTTAAGSTIFAVEQSKTTLPMEARMLATYEQEPIDAWRVRTVDSYGNGYTYSNPLPINIIPKSQIPFTLGALALPTLVANLISGINYTEVISDSIDGEEILTFYDTGVAVTTITLTQTSDGWILNSGALLEDFLLLETGSLIELESGIGAILLEN